MTKFSYDYYQPSTLPTPGFAWPTRPSRPIEVDDQAPIPLIVGIALALFIGFVIIVCCICRRRSLSGSSSSNNQESNAAYQRAPTADGTPAAGGFNTGVGGNSYPMAPVNSMYPPAQGQPTVPGAGVPGQTVPGGINMAQHQQAPQHPYPSLPPNAYTPPYPIGYAPLPAYMPTSQSSHASSASGPSSDHGPSGFSSSPPAPAPAPTGMMATSGSGDTPAVAMSSLTTQSKLPESELGSEGTEAGQINPGMGTLGHQQQGSVSLNQGQMSYGYGVQGQGPPNQMVNHPGYHASGIPSQAVGHPGFQGSVMGQRGMVGMGGMQGAGYGLQGPEKGMVMGPGSVAYPPTMHTTAMDYVPGGGFIPRVGSPMPPAGTTVTELDHL